MLSSNNITKDIHEEYNSIPVFFCKNCLSLRIINLDDFVDYCDDCGCTSTDTTNIEDWEKMYENKYGKPFNIKKNGRE